MQDQDQDKILARVKKMLALGNDNTAHEGERENALRMAYNLLAKHNLSMSQVDAHNSTPQEQREQQEAKFVVYPWARSIANSVASLFFCNYYYSRSGVGKQARHTFIGKTSNAQTASYVAEFVVKSVLREAAKLYGSAIAPEARCFAVGVVNKLRERIAQLKKAQEDDGPKSNALVLVNLYVAEHKANELWLSQQGVTLRTTKSKTKGVTDSDAYHAGKAFGATVSLSAGIGHSGGASHKRLS